MFDVINASAHTGSDCLAAYVNTAGDDAHEVRLNIMDWTWRVALDIIGRVAFNHDFQCGESEDAKALHRSWVDQANAGLEKMGFIVSLVGLYEHRGAWTLISDYGQGLLVLRAFPFIARLPLKAIAAQENVKRILQDIGQSMLETNLEETKNNNFLSSIGSYLNACSLLDNADFSPFYSTPGNGQ